VILMQDETIIRLFPALRRAWSLQGVQACVGVSGRNDQRVLSLALNICSGEIVTLIHRRMNSEGFQQLLARVRAHYGTFPIAMLLDGGSLHRATASLKSAEELNIVLIELPRQCPELNAVDHLWRSVKADVSANYQYPTIDAHAQKALEYVKGLMPKERLARAGVLSNAFWLKRFL
jgi:transposase